MGIIDILIMFDSMECCE